MWVWMYATHMSSPHQGCKVKPLPVITFSDYVRHAKCFYWMTNQKIILSYCTIRTCVTQAKCMREYYNNEVSSSDSSLVMTSRVNLIVLTED